MFSYHAPVADEFRRRYTRGNLYEKRMSTLVSFSAHCKTIEFRSRMSLPPIAKDLIGTGEKTLRIEIGFTRREFLVKYKNIFIKDKKAGIDRPIYRLKDGWGEVSRFLELEQGDTVYFERCNRVVDRFHVSVDRHDACRVVNPEVKEEIDEDWSGCSWN